MKRILLMPVIVLFGFSLYASLLGLKMEMTVNEIVESCDDTEAKHIKDDCYYIVPVKTHPLFEHSIAFVDEKKDLYRIKAVTKTIKSNEYGTEIKNPFEEIKGRIAKVYGKPQIIDEIEPEYYLKDDLVRVSICANAVESCLGERGNCLGIRFCKQGISRGFSERCILEKNFGIKL